MAPGPLDPEALPARDRRRLAIANAVTLAVYLAVLAWVGWRFFSTG